MNTIVERVRKSVAGLGTAPYYMQREAADLLEELARRNEAQEKEIEQLRADKDVRRAQERNTAYEADIKKLETERAELLAALKTAYAGLHGIRLNRVQLDKIDTAIAKAEGGGNA